MLRKIDDEIVWDTVKEGLPELRKAILRALDPQTGGGIAARE
jgi:uncharacterized protein with HEPN domain